MLTTKHNRLETINLAFFNSWWGTIGALLFLSWITKPISNNINRKETIKDLSYYNHIDSLQQGK